MAKTDTGVEYIPYAELDDEHKALADSEDYTDRMTAVTLGAGLDVLVADESNTVREMVARKGYRLDKLIDDGSALVRAAVARRGYGLERLVDDADWTVRLAVAEAGFGLERLVHDDEALVRYAVAEQGFGLDVLAGDESAFVRKEVARQGYGLDELVDDSDLEVRIVVAEQGRAQDLYKLAEDDSLFVSFVAEVMLEEMRGRDEAAGALERIRHGYIPYEMLPDEYREAVGSDSPTDRKYAASLGWGLDELVHDPDAGVRAQVAHHAYGLDKLVDDEDYYVSCTAEGELAASRCGTVERWAAENPDRCVLEENREERGKQGRRTSKNPAKEDMERGKKAAQGQGKQAARDVPAHGKKV